MQVSPFILLSYTLIRPDKGCYLPAVLLYTADSFLSALILVFQSTVLYVGIFVILSMKNKTKKKKQVAPVDMFLAAVHQLSGLSVSCSLYWKCIFFFFAF